MNTAYLFLIVTIPFLCVLYLLHLSRKRFLLLKKIEALRLHIARDLHDDIGATLSSISFYSQAVKQNLHASNVTNAEKINEQIGLLSREMMENMNDIVWMVNPKNDTTDKFFERINDYGNTLFLSNNITFMFYADNKLLDMTMDMNMRKAFYLICKEAMNNALKHANCNTFEILIKKQANDIVTILKDNGNGFVVDKQNNGNGLLNMKVRVEEMGGNYSIQTSPNKGTVISFKFAVPPKW